MFRDFGRVESFDISTDGLITLQLSATYDALEPLDPTAVC